MTNIKLARQQADLTQWDMAMALGVSESRMCWIETGRAAPLPEQRDRIAALLEIDGNLLFDGNGCARTASVSFRDQRLD